MSDYERVELTPAQFAKWNELAQAQVNALWRIAEVMTSLKDQRLEKKVDRLIELLEAGVHIPDIGFISAKLGLISDLLEGENGAIPTINTLIGKVETMSSNIDRIEKEAADAAENVQMVKTALDTVNSTVADLKTMVADLQAQVAQGQVDQARLDAAASTLEKADDDLDALVLPAPSGGGGETGGGTGGSTAGGPA